MKNMEEFNKEEFLKKLQKDLERLSKKSYRYGVDSALQALEKFLDSEEIPDPISKESLRFHINEFRKVNEIEKQKLLNHEEEKNEDKDKEKDN